MRLLRRRPHGGMVLRPTGLEEAPGLTTDVPVGPVLCWRKRKCGPLVFVLTEWSLRLRRLRVVGAASAATGFIKAAPAVPYRRTPPRILNAPPELACLHAAELAASPALPPDGGLALFTDATISASGVILTADGRLIAESLLNAERWSAFGVFVRPAPAAPLQMKAKPVAVQRRLAACPHVMMKQTYDANYGHWLIECLPRLAAVAEHFDLSACRFIVSDGHGAMQRIYIDSLGAFGIKPEQIVTVGYAPMHVDLLVYPLPITEHPWVKSPSAVAVLETLRRTMVLPEVSGPKRIYVSRNKGGSRRLLNEAAILAIVERHGFAVVHPETMAFAAQVATFRNAEIVVGNYGANLSNTVFAPCGLTLLALTTEFMQDDFFWDLMDHKAGSYVSLHGTAVGPQPDQDSDFAIDVAAFERVLDAVISAPRGPETTEAAHRCSR